MSDLSFLFLFSAGSREHSSNALAVQPASHRAPRSMSIKERPASLSRSHRLAQLGYVINQDARFLPWSICARRGTQELDAQLGSTTGYVGKVYKANKIYTLWSSYLYTVSSATVIAKARENLDSKTHNRFSFRLVA